MDGPKDIKEMRRRRKMFPWLKAFYSKYSEKFLDNDKLEALNYLMVNIDFEVENIISEDNYEKAQEFFKVLKFLFLHFCWQIRWKSLKTWKKYWKKAEICEVTTTSIQKECCVKLLLSLIQMAIFLTKGCPDSHWVDCVLTTIKLLPDSLNISCDALLLINNLKKKHMLIYCVILKHLLFSKIFETITVPATYIKVILLFRRLLKFTKQEKEKDYIKILASKLKPPSDIISWLLSLNIGTVKTLKVENLTQDFLSRPFPDEFLRKLSEALRKEEQLHKNIMQVLTTEENNDQDHTFSKTNFLNEDSLVDTLKGTTLEIPTKILPQTNCSTFDKNEETNFEETGNLEAINKRKSEENILDNLSSFSVKASVKETENMDKNVKKSKKEDQTVFSTDDMNIDVTKSHKKKKKKSEKDGKCYSKHTSTDDKNQSVILSNSIQSEEISNETEKVGNVLEEEIIAISGENMSQANERYNESGDTMDKKVNVFESVRKHKKKKKSKKSKKHKKEKRNKKCDKDYGVANSDSEDCKSQIVNPNCESQTENSNEREIHNQMNHSVKKNFKADEKMLTINKNSMCPEKDLPSPEKQSYINNSKIINNFDLTTENCFKNNPFNSIKQTGNILAKNALKQNYAHDTKEKSKIKRKKLFDIENNYYDKNRNNSTNPDVSKTIQDSTLNNSAQHEVSEAIKQNEFINDTNNSISNRNNCEGEFTNLTVTDSEKGIMPMHSDNINNCESSSSVTKEFSENLISSDVSISELLKLTPINLYRHNKILNLEQSCSKYKHINHSYNFSQSKDSAYISDIENTLKINKRRKKYSSQCFSLKSCSQSIRKTTENILLNRSKKILKQTYSHEHCSSPSLFDEEIISNSGENSINNISSQDERILDSMVSECEMQSSKQNFEMHLNGANEYIHCDENSRISSIQESNVSALGTESNKAQSLESDHDMKHLKKDFRVNSHYIVTDIPCDRNTLSSNNQEFTTSRVKEKNETSEIHSEHNLNQLKENNKKDCYSTFLNEQSNKNLCDLTFQESNTLIGVTESNEIRSAVFQHYKTDAVFPNLSDDKDKHLSMNNHTHCYENSGDYIATKTNNSHLQSINLPFTVSKDIQNYQIASPAQESQSLLTRVSNNYMNSNFSNENSNCQSPSLVNGKPNEIQSCNFDNSYEILNDINGNGGDISDIVTQCEKKTFLQNSKSTLYSRFSNDSGISFINSKQTLPNSTIQVIDDNISVENPAFIKEAKNQNTSSYKNSNIEKNIPNAFSENESSELSNSPSTFVIDCKVINNHNITNDSTLQNVSSVQVIINLNNGNNQPLEGKNKIIANFDFQSNSKSFISSSPCDTNCLPNHIPGNDNSSSSKNMTVHELPFVKNLNSSKNSIKNAYLSYENNEISTGDSHQNSLNSFYNSNANNSHIDNIPSTSNFLSDNTMERNLSKDIAIQTEIETLNDASLNDINLSNPLPFETSIFEEININAKSNNHQNVQNQNNNEHPSKKVKPLNSKNLTTLNNQSNFSPAIKNSNPSSSYRNNISIYSDISEDDISVSTVTNISEDELNNSELLENSDTENNSHNFVKTSKEIKLPSFEIFKQNLFTKSSPKKRLIFDDNNYINSNKKIASDKCSSSSDISNSKCKKNVTKCKRKPVKQRPLCLESKSHQYCLRSRKSLKKPGKYDNFI